MVAEPLSTIETVETAKPAKKRVREPRLRRSAAWSLTVAGRVEPTTLPEEKG